MFRIEPDLAELPERNRGSLPAACQKSEWRLINSLLRLIAGLVNDGASVTPGPVDHPAA
jgi:hypothetical protein